MITRSKLKRSIRRLKKDILMGQEINIQNLRLAKLPLPLCIKLSEKFGLVKKEYKAGETIVDMISGDMIELSEPYNNGEKKMGYRNIWNFYRYGNKMWYKKEYDDDFGGTLSLLPCDLLFESTNLVKKYDHIYRLATEAEKRCK